MSIVLWSLAVAGSALILTQSSILKPFRDWLTKEPAPIDTLVQILNAVEAPDVEILPTGEVRNGRPPPWRTRARMFVGKLVSCPMCSGFWLGLAWAFAFGSRGTILAAHGFAGSIVSALAVATWLVLHETHQTLALWRYNHPPKDGP